MARNRLAAAVKRGCAQNLPQVFGSQDTLLSIARSGVVELPSTASRYMVCVSGLCRLGLRSREAALNIGHPAFPELRAVLEDLLGSSISPPVLPGSPAFDRERPLGHRGHTAYRVMLVFARATTLDRDSLAKRLSDIHRTSVLTTIVDLAEAGVLIDAGGGQLAFSPRVPASFIRLLLRLAELIGNEHVAERHDVGPRPLGFVPPSDGAPILFGTDYAFRNLAALAVYGPMYLTDLRRITGAYNVAQDTEDLAPFTRSGVVRTWDTDDGPAGMLDPGFPAYDELLRLLKRLSTLFPPASETRLGGVPEIPPQKGWDGDAFRIFGSELRTKILMTLGTYGWTFEALCHSICGLHRENVKHCIRKLEDGGILAGDRPRGPGFDVRALRIADTFPAQPELQAFLTALSREVGMDETVRKHFMLLLNKTKVHLSNRGLWPDDLPRPQAKSNTVILTRKNLTRESAVAVAETIKSQKARRRENR